MRHYLRCILGILLLLGGVIQAQTDIACEDSARENDDLAYYVGLGNGYYNQGDFNTAIIVYGCALELDANYAPAYVRRGFAYAALGNQTDALADYNQALEIDDVFISAYINRGNLYTSQGRFGLALTDFDLAIALDPENAVAYNNRAVVYAAEGDYVLAISDLEQALALAPDYAMPYATLGVVYSAMAVEQYAQYRVLEGESARLPAGDASTVVQSLEIERETGSVGTWLALQTPSQ